MSNGKKVLIADDEPDILNQWSVVFKIKGYNVVTAADGQEAIEKIKAERPDAAVLDFMMPNVDGMTVCREAKEFNPKMFVLIVSGVDNELIREYSQKVQADEYFEKPLSIKTLVEAVNAGIARYQQ
jgi:two-component system, OmpR family, alkaline phosphatase synthesis response regulator PhoP